MTLVRVDEKGRVLLSKELRRKTGVERNDLLEAKPLSKGKILLERPSHQPEKKDTLDWLLSHPGKIRSPKLAKEIEKMSSTRELIDKWKDELWTGE